LKLDLTVTNAGAPLPLIIHIHGGGWKSGSHKDSPKYYGLVDRGFAFAAIEYRLSGEAAFPAQLLDCKAAVRFFKANASVYNIDAGRIGVIGGSAGGHLAALLGVAAGADGFEDDINWPGYSSEVQAVVNISGPSDVPLLITTARSCDQIITERMRVSGLFTEDTIRRVSNVSFGRDQAWFSDFIGGNLGDNMDNARAASPLSYISENQPPFLIVHGESDCIVPYIHAVKLYEALRKAGADAELITLPNTPHGIYCDLDGKSNDWVYGRIYSFFENYLQRGGA